MPVIETKTSAPTHRGVEAVVAVVIAVFGGVVVLGSVQAGITWGPEGPRAGFFPFYVGLCIIAASAINFLNALRSDPDTLFAEWVQIRHVFSVINPTAVYVLAMPFVGLYVGSALFIAYFMRVLGKYRWLTTLAVAIGTPVVAYIVFERWFLVPLPKGPLEDWLGL
ncbi:tripartite tricarboxylate transporter TctB family protein [Rhodopseudomonas telluris]|uniref:Tripartite tricarboxylate transporter TctB family protein n=1 Tax=Rhodopseudomonas telluris TaxID=644215 RepID=A0ABV6ESK4_9BRAD